MNEKIMKKLLPIFYIFCLVCFLSCGILFYKTKTEQKNRLININNKVDMPNIGDQIELEINDNIQSEDIIYQIEDENIVEIENGVLVGTNEGSTKVTITNKDKTKTQTFTVNIGKAAIESYKEKNSNNDSIKNNDSSNESNANQNVNNNSENNSNSNNTNINTNNSSSHNTTNNIDNNNNNNNNSNDENINTNYNSSQNVNNNNSNSNNNNISSNSNNSTTNNTVNVRSISLNKKSDEIYLNSKTKTITLTATITPDNATNKTVSWTSSNNKVATVNNGIVTAISPGVTTISAKTKDGNKVANMTITVKKKIIIVIGASQVTRMAWYKRNYSSNNFNYNTDNGTLIYINEGGSGINYQTNEGLTKAKKTINSYSNVKQQIDFHIYFPLSGNTIKNFACNEITTSNNKIKGYAKNYNDAIQSLKNSGYTIKGYVVSMHPVKVSQSTKDDVVTNENENSCTVGFRSNWKYYLFNKRIKSIIETNYRSNLTYESLFIQIMEVNNNKQNFSYKITYNTEDGIHWDSATTKNYVNMMFDYTNDL